MPQEVDAAEEDDEGCVAEVDGERVDKHVEGHERDVGVVQDELVSAEVAV